MILQREFLQGENIFSFECVAVISREISWKKKCNINVMLLLVSVFAAISFTSWPFKNKQNKWQFKKIHLIIPDIQVNKKIKAKYFIVKFTWIIHLNIEYNLFGLSFILFTAMLGPIRILIKAKQKSPCELNVALVAVSNSHLTQFDATFNMV